jgi:cell wall assembly regulator SMI1
MNSSAGAGHQQSLDDTGVTDSDSIGSWFQTPGEPSMKTSPYKVGQRWKFKTDVAEFEDSLVIGRIDGRDYEVYVRYIPSESLPPNKDGEVLGLSKAGLDRNVTELVESGVKLPWWWVLGVRFASMKEAQKAGLQSINVMLCDGLLQDSLRAAYLSLQEEQQEQEFQRQRTQAIKQAKREIKQRGPARPSKSIAESWERIRAYYSGPGSTLPGAQQILHPGATPAAIAAFEASIGQALPDDFKESLRLHDGGDNFWFTETSGEFLSLAGMLKQWKQYRQAQRQGKYATETEDWQASDIEGPIKPIFWNTKRIPVTDNSGDHWTLDLDPPEDGAYGQILDHSHEVGPTQVLARSWTELLAQLVVDLENGKYL